MFRFLQNKKNHKRYGPFFRPTSDGCFSVSGNSRTDYDRTKTKITCELPTVFDKNVIKISDRNSLGKPRKIRNSNYNEIRDCDVRISRRRSSPFTHTHTYRRNPIFSFTYFFFLFIIYMYTFFFFYIYIVLFLDALAPREGGGCL